MSYIDFIDGTAYLVSNMILFSVPHITGMNERKTISQYLEEDLNASYSPKSTQSTSKQSRAIRRRERGRRLSLDPMTRIKVEKLEVV